MSGRKGMRHYLSMIRDLFDNSIVAYKTGTQQTVNLVLDTIRLAMKREKKRVAAELHLHSDQGFQYTSQAYFNLTQEYGITPSMSRRGNPYDNAMAENFFSILKTECIYLKKQYLEEYRNPVEAFRKIDQTTDFPEMSRLLSELQNYRGDGMAAKLFYESKVAEALSLVVEYQKKGPAFPSKLSQSDLERIQTVAAYLSDHYAAEIPMERLTQIACMGTTKLKSSFKKVYDCTITEYIQQRRMSQAEYLLTSTDLSIGQIAQTVGYSTSSRFAELFRMSTGLLPGEFRKVGRR